MNEEQFSAQVRRLAHSRCKARHPDYYDSLIYFRPGNFGTPCDSCIAQTNDELIAKRRKDNEQREKEND